MAKGEGTGCTGMLAFLVLFNAGGPALGLLLFPFALAADVIVFPAGLPRCVPWWAWVGAAAARLAVRCLWRNG